MSGEFEQNKGKLRVIPTRPSDLGTAGAEAERAGDHGTGGRFTRGNKAAARRGAKRALRRPYSEARERIRKAVSEAASAGVDVSELPTADKLMADAFHVHMAGMSELGSRSVFVLGQALVFAVESVLHGFYLEAAAAAGLLTERGAELKALADSCATLAGRASTSCMAASKFLGGRRKRDEHPVDKFRREALKKTGGKAL